MAEWMETCPNHQYLLLLASQVPTDPYLAISPPLPAQNSESRHLFTYSESPGAFLFNAMLKHWGILRLVWTLDSELAWAFLICSSRATLNQGSLWNLLSSQSPTQMQVRGIFCPWNLNLIWGFCWVLSLGSRHVQHVFSGICHPSAILIPGLTLSPGEHFSKSGDTFSHQKWTSVLLSSVPMPTIFLNILWCSGWVPPPYCYLKKRVTHPKISVVLRLKYTALKLCEMITQCWWILWLL